MNSVAAKNGVTFASAFRLGGGVLVWALIIAMAALILKPDFVEAQVSQEELEQVIPASFGEWREIDTGIKPVSVQVTIDQLTESQPYDAQVMRSYVNAKGQVMMLAIAYGSNQRQEVKIHRPEVCYKAQGREIQAIRSFTWPIADPTGQQVSGMQMISVDSRSGAIEPVHYWIRIGHIFSQSGLQQRLHILAEGLKGRRSDGVLVRVSQTLPARGDVQSSSQIQTDFIQQMLAAMTPQGRKLLLG